MQSYDVVIVGGGVMGSSVAYFLKGWLNFPGSVLVVERDPDLCRCGHAPRRRWHPPAILHAGEHPHGPVRCRLHQEGG